MQSGYKTCESKLTLKKREDRYYHRKFWLNNFSSLHERVRLQLKECLDKGFLPSWLTRGRTSLLQKDQSKGGVASN